MMGQEELKEILRLHALWLSKDPLGKRAGLMGAGADLREAYLTGANLSGANLKDKNELVF